ncbi:MAG TPA: glycosyltransferase family 4 protein [Steroidobacteraceae bacterium]|nr:glycosyltransferase family 4 protein [Steroidobacteraceae bacterium]
MAATSLTRELPQRVRLAVVSTHPIQYYAPQFAALARLASLRLRVFYTWPQAARTVADAGFGRDIRWDLPLLSGYDHEFVENTAPRPGPDHFRGVVNPRLCRAIAAWKPDAVLVFGWNLYSHLQALRYFKGRVPVLFRGDSTLLDPRPPLATLARRLMLRWVYRHIDAAIAVGSNNADYFRWCGVPSARIAFAPHAIDTARFADEAAHAQQTRRFREQLGIAAGERVLLYAGKLIPKKDPLLLLQAYLDCRHPGHLVFVGDGALEPALRTLAQGRGNVHFLPFQNQQAMPAVYRLGDVFVLPSCGPGETWGLAINEAMASGRPVIASDRCGGARDLIDEGVNGWVFRAGDRGRLAARIAEVMSCDAGRLSGMGAAAHRASGQWSIEAAASDIGEAVLERVIPARAADCLPAGP